MHDLVTRALPPRPWTEGHNIPWNDPAFSARMLREHLSQDHDLASRRTHRIDEHVAWIHREVLDEAASDILDLGCGPGLYARRLAERGHRCVGLDFSPASIDHARRHAEGLACTFRLVDLRHAVLPPDQDLVLLNYGQLNVFPRHVAADLLRRAGNALRPGGQLLLEVQTEAVIRSADNAAPAWHSADGGLFADGPHLVLHERFWDEPLRCSTERWHVVAPDGRITRFALSNEAYSTDELVDTVMSAGFSEVEVLDGFGGRPDPSMVGLRATR